jgi:predicted transcriptional regulator
MPAITIVIPDEADRQLDALAERDFRHPRDEAAFLLVQAIEAESE